MVLLFVWRVFYNVIALGIIIAVLTSGNAPRLVILGLVMIYLTLISRFRGNGYENELDRLKSEERHVELMRALHSPSIAAIEKEFEKNTELHRKMARFLWVDLAFAAIAWVLSVWCLFQAI